MRNDSRSEITSKTTSGLWAFKWVNTCFHLLLNEWFQYLSVCGRRIYVLYVRASAQSWRHMAETAGWLILKLLDILFMCHLNLNESTFYFEIIPHYHFLNLWHKRLKRLTMTSTGPMFNPNFKRLRIGICQYIMKLWVWKILSVCVMGKLVF